MREASTPGPPPGHSPEQRRACASSSTVGEGGAARRGRFSATGLLGSQPAPGLRNKPMGSHPTNKPDKPDLPEQLWKPWDK